MTTRKITTPTRITPPIMPHKRGQLTTGAGVGVGGVGDGGDGGAGDGGETGFSFTVNEPLSPLTSTK